MVGARRDRTHDIYLFLSGCTEIYPRRTRRDLTPERTAPADCSAGPRERGVHGPFIPSPARSVPPLSGVTLTALLVAVLTLGSPASGIRVPIPDPPRVCARIGREAGAAAPPPPALDSELGNPEGKERGGGARRLETHPPPAGIPSSQAAPRPFFSLPYPRGQRWGREPAGGPRVGEGARRGWRLQPSGRKVGRRQAEGIPAGPGLLEEALAHLLVPRPGSRDGRQRLGTDSLGAGLRAPGEGSAAPGARSPHPTGAAAVSAPPLGSGSGARRAARARAGGGVGGGPRLGSAWGLGPQAGSAPERRAPDSARGAPPALRVKSWAPAGAHTPALTWGRPATESGPRGHDRRAQTRHTRGYTHSYPETFCHRHLRLRGQADTLAQARCALTQAH